jgi:hypothetical protein
MGSFSVAAKNNRIYLFAVKAMDNMSRRNNIYLPK